MKNFMIFLLAILSMTGCAAEPTFETIGNVWDNPQIQDSPASIEFTIADDAQMEMMESTQTSKCYQIGQWMLWTEILSGGDVAATMETLTGISADALNIMEHPLGQYQCHETAWAYSAEEGEYVIRTAVIPQGEYHYCISLKVPMEDAQQVGSFFSGILRSVYLNDTAA